MFVDAVFDEIFQTFIEVGAFLLFGFVIVCALCIIIGVVIELSKNKKKRGQENELKTSGEKRF